MSITRKIADQLFPHAVLDDRDLRDAWRVQEKQNFLATTKIFFATAFVGYLLHYFTVDQLEGVAPSELWFNYRFSMAALAAICLWLYSRPFILRIQKGYRVPAIIASLLFCYFQTRTIIWYPKVPHAYSFAFVIAAVIMLRAHLIFSLIVTVVFLGTIIPTLIEANVSGAMVLSGTLFTIAIIIPMSFQYTSSLNHFLGAQIALQNQKRLREIDREFSAALIQSRHDIANQVAHDIRSPLSALNILASRVTETLAAEEKILFLNATKRINGIANNLLRNPSKGTCNIHEVFIEAFQEAKLNLVTLPNKVIDLAAYPPQSGPAEMYAAISALELSRVLSNLLNNAIEAIQQRGCVAFKLEYHIDFATITIEDNGRGILDEQLPMIGLRGASFGKAKRPSTRADGTEETIDSTNWIEGGSGLGLYHAKQAIESIGGQIIIQSTINIGTTISITIPLAR